MARPQDISADGASDGLRPIAVKLEIPFCIHHCPFCERNVIEGWDSARMHGYMLALQREIEANAEAFRDCRVVAVRIGGGLASMAPAADLADTVNLLRARYRVEPDAPVTMRSAIANISGASMPFFLRTGVTRFDFEMMSLDSFDFPQVNRKDNLRDFPVVCECFLHSYANDRLGLVMAYGLDGNEAPFRRSMLACARGDASHVELVEYRGAGEACAQDKAEQLECARGILEAAGLHEYAPLLFARSGKEDGFAAHALSGGETVGFGLGASTRFDCAETVNTRVLEDYLAHSDDFRLITAEARSL